ncbi:transcription antitermination factor NusB [Spirulina subsalsa FACHB-351]|uniref:Transcription antitermination protein NusB n=1 Tax=Spirulina subsalsa FACHB-351 TaxID=234711 RepID=A0ABT3L567_9CYAN|nr:transcription antitermination factor NusB [Spirulina subsalsa]MCW6036661.1 transcription antitermination factor NusB [Spirulina subsalsa FACHB-351]
MPVRQQPRRIARELALLGLSQVSGNPEKLTQQRLSDLVLAAIRTLTAEVREVLETAAAEATRGSDRLLTSETRAVDVKSAKAMVEEALELTQTAINRLGYVVDLPEVIHLANKQEVREYAIELIGTVKRRQAEIDQVLNDSLVDWQVNRLPQVDQQILEIAVAEILYLEVPERIAINEAVEIAKRYSDEEGARFINGALRRVINRKIGKIND